MTRDEYNEVKLGLQTATNRADFALSCLQKQLAEFEAANSPKVVCPYCGRLMVQTIRNTWWYCILSGGGCGLAGPDNDPDGSKVMSLAKPRKLPIKPPFFVALDGLAYSFVGFRIPVCEDDYLHDDGTIHHVHPHHMPYENKRPILSASLDIHEFLP